MSWLTCRSGAISDTFNLRLWMPEFYDVVQVHLDDFCETFPSRQVAKHSLPFLTLREGNQEALTSCVIHAAIARQQVVKRFT